MKVVILESDLGTRIFEESHLKPKPMIEMGTQPILWHIMKTYSYYGYNGFGLYDKIFIDAIKQIEDPNPYLKGIVGEFAMHQSIITYHQRESVRGSSNFNFSKYYDVAMLGITSYTKALMRMTTFIGVLLGGLCRLYAIVIFFLKIFNWDSFPAGIPSIVVGIFFIGAIQLLFLGILGEYILSINTRVVKRPLVIPEKKINFDIEDN